MGLFAVSQGLSAIQPLTHWSRPESQPLRGWESRAVAVGYSRAHCKGLSAPALLGLESVKLMRPSQGLEGGVQEPWPQHEGASDGYMKEASRKGQEGDESVTICHYMGSGKAHGPLSSTKSSEHPPCARLSFRCSGHSADTALHTADTSIHPDPRLVGDANESKPSGGYNAGKWLSAGAGFVPVEVLPQAEVFPPVQWGMVNRGITSVQSLSV